MSVTALRPQRAELPTELWYHIFRLATEVEGEFDPLLWSQKHTEAPLRDLFTSSVFSTYIRATRSAIEASFPTRRAITTVSRRWRATGITILYSSVTLKSHANMIVFLDILEQSARGNAQSRGPARCVKRITFGPSRFAKFEDSERTMARILPLCTELVILVDDGPASGPGQFPFPAFPPLIQCPNLRYIFGEKSIAPIPSPEPWKWLSSMKNLRAITLEIYERDFEYNTSSQASLPALHLPHLHTLQFTDKGSTVAQSVSTWNLPSLRNLVFTEENSSRAFYYILKAHGHKIERLVFTCGFRKDDDESENDLELSIPSLLRLKFLSIPLLEPDELPSFIPFITSPNLQVVEFPIDIHYIMPPGEESFDYLTLGEVDLESVPEVLDFLLDAGETPSLQIIRLLKKSPGRARALKYWLKKLEKKLWERGVRLQVEWGMGDSRVAHYYSGS